MWIIFKSNVYVPFWLYAFYERQPLLLTLIEQRRKNTFEQRLEHEQLEKKICTEFVFWPISYQRRSIRPHRDFIQFFLTNIFWSISETLSAYVQATHHHSQIFYALCCLKQCCVSFNFLKLVKLTALALFEISSVFPARFDHANRLLFKMH